MRALTSAATIAETPGKPIRLRTIVGVALALVFIYLVLRAVNWRELVQALGHARIGLLLFGLLIGSGSYMVRALRWQLLLRAQDPISFFPVFWANSAGYLGNNVLPARAGELLRCVMVSGHSGLSRAFVLSTAFAERMADVIALLILAGLVNFFSSALPNTLRPMNVAVLGTAVLGMVLLAMPGVLERPTGFVLNKLLPGRMRDRAFELVTHAVTGLRCFHHLGRLSAFVVLTSVIWLLDACGVMIAARALNLVVPFAIALLLLAALGLSSMVPALPGQIGIFQFVTIAVVRTVKIDHTQGLTYGLILQASSFLTIGFWGVIGIWKCRHSVR